MRAIILNDITIQITFSIGIAIYPEDASDMRLLIQKADVAMYAARHYGSGLYRQWGGK